MITFGDRFQWLPLVIFFNAQLWCCRLSVYEEHERLSELNGFKCLRSGIECIEWKQNEIKLKLKITLGNHMKVSWNQTKLKRNPMKPNGSQIMNRLEKIQLVRIFNENINGHTITEPLIDSDSPSIVSITFRWKLFNEQLSRVEGIFRLKAYDRRIIPSFPLNNFRWLSRNS